MNGMERLAQAERDCVDLHKALAEALHRITRHNDTFHTTHRLSPEVRIQTSDLLEVLERTSRPSNKRA